MDNVDRSLEAKQAEKKRKQMVRRQVLARKIDRIRRELELIDSQHADMQEAAIHAPDETRVIVSLAERRQHLVQELDDLRQEEAQLQT